MQILQDGWTLVDRLQLGSRNARELRNGGHVGPQRELAVPRGSLTVEHLRYFAGWPTKIVGETIPVTWPNAFCYTLKEPDSPQLVLIPVVQNLSGGTTWPNGSSAQIKVVGFAWFVIESCGDPANPTYCRNSDGGEVNGRFVNIQDDDPFNDTGGWTPGSNTDYQVELTA